MSEKVWLGEQERVYSCGAASLKYALCMLGYSPREGDLRKLAKTSWRHGTQTNSLVAAAKKFGVTAKVRHFLDDEWVAARAWLGEELAAGHPVILDVDGFQHYVAAVQMLGKDVVVLDPEGGPMDGSAYARLVLCNDARLKRWWLSGEEEGEPEAFRGIALALGPASTPKKAQQQQGGGPPRSPSTRAPRTPSGPALRFDEKTMHRYTGGRPWILDEYLIDVVEIAKAASLAPHAPGAPRALVDVVHELTPTLVERTTHWHGAGAGERSMVKAHLQDIALAAHAMQLTIPSTSMHVVAADVAAILVEMLNADD